MGGQHLTCSPAGRKVAAGQQGGTPYREYRLYSAFCGALLDAFRGWLHLACLPVSQTTGGKRSGV